jgi:antitoxin component YwqK of YwqJK toxin-antitoxin module
MNAYKSGITENNIRVLITLFIPIRAKTNMTRKNVTNKLYAKYRCDVAKVILIIDENNITYNSAKSAYYFEPIIYIVGNTIKSEFDENINIVTGKGIHFFIDKLVALNYNKPILEQKWPASRPNTLYTNLYKSFYPNGHLRERISYTLKNNEIYQKYIEVWYENGVRKYSQSLILDERNGMFNEWYKNGQFKSSCNYLNDAKFGIEKRFYENGNKQSYINYIDGILHGIYKTWNYNGTIKEETIYIYGEEKIINNNMSNNQISNCLSELSSIYSTTCSENESIPAQINLKFNNSSKLRLIRDINKSRSDHYSWNCS